MQLSRKGFELIKHLEGVRLVRYKDSQGLWTIGIGHLITGNENPPIAHAISMQRCELLFLEDSKRFADCINDAVKVELTQNEFDALFAFCYNIGEGAFRGSTLLQKINNNDFNGAVKEMLRWTKQEELIGRRIKEMNVFHNGIYPV